MASRSYLVAALLGALGSLVLGPSAHAEDDDLDGDGPEADSVALFELEDLIKVAVQKSPDLVRAKADRSIAKGQAGAARADQQWVMTMGANYKTQAVSAQVFIEPFGLVRTDTINGAIGLGRNLPTGANLQVELGIGHVEREINVPEQFLGQPTGDGAGNGAGSGSSSAAQPDVISDRYTMIQSQARVTLKQPLVRGFGPDVALAAIKKADFASAAATIAAQLEAENMVRDIVAGYWELAYATFAVDTRAQSLQLAELQEKATREELRAGKAPQNALNAVIYEIMIRKEAQLTAQLDAERKSLELRRKAGLGLGRREVMMRPGEALEIGDAEWDIEDVIARSRTTNRKLATIALQKKIADTDVKVASNALLPQVDVSLSAALLGTGSTTGESFGGLGGLEGYEVMAGLSVSFELSGAAKSAQDAALARRRRLDVDRADLERQIDAEVVNSVKAVTAARARVALSDKAIAVAEENAKAEKLSFLTGRTTNFSVMQRQTELIDARLRRGRAVADHHIAVAQLQWLSGTLLEQYRINVRPRSKR